MYQVNNAMKYKIVSGTKCKDQILSFSLNNTKKIKMSSYTVCYT